MSFSKKFGICLCILPASASILILVLDTSSLGNFLIALLLMVLALILFIPGLIFLIVGIKKDREKKNETDASKSETNFQSFSESEPDNSKKDKKIRKEKKEKKKNNKKKQSEQEFTMEDFD